MGKDKIEISPEMIDAATEAIRPYFDVFASWLAPVWAKLALEAAVMRQAGRYLPEYRAVRATTRSFLDFCYTLAGGGRVGEDRGWSGRRSSCPFPPLRLVW